MYVESCSEFTERQGCEWIDTPAARLFANGAAWRFHRAGWEDPGSAVEVPEDPVQVLLRRSRYVELMLEREEAVFKNVRGVLMAQAEIAAHDAGPEPTLQDLMFLRQCRNKVRELRAQLEGLQGELQDVQPHTTNHRAQLKEQNKANGRRLLREIATIHI